MTVLVTLFGGDPKWHLKNHATLNTDVICPRLKMLVDELSLVRRKVVTFQNELPKYRKLYEKKLQEKSQRRQKCFRNLYTGDRGLCNGEYPRILMVAKR